MYEENERLVNYPLIEQKTAIWKDVSFSTYVFGLPYESAYQCSNCNKLRKGGWTEYCPHCGAKMGGVKYGVY